jgi:hypothetical protein
VGTLTIVDVYGYTPKSGTSLTILTYASRGGDFSTKNLHGFSSAMPGTTSDVLKD